MKRSEGDDSDFLYGTTAESLYPIGLLSLFSHWAAPSVLVEATNTPLVAEGRTASGSTASEVD